MKITPINFSSYLEPELASFWEEHRFSEGKTVEVQRTHDLKHRQTTLNAVATDEQGISTLLSSIQLIEIPQQEQNPALNCMIYLSHMDHPTQLLMVFKTEDDAEKWATKIVSKIRILMVGAPDLTEVEPAEDSEENAEDENETEAEAEAEASSDIVDDETDTA